MLLVLLVVLTVVLVGSLPQWPHAANWGYYPSGIVGVALLVLLILILTGGLR